MQGADCPSSIIAALDAIIASGEVYDAVLILRGGGSKLDLACFDDYELAAVIAQYPLPVLTAIGHDQDYHVCDMVAYEFVKTPTALADFILAMYEDEDARISSYVTRIRLAFSNRLLAMEMPIERLQSRIRNGYAMKISLMDSRLQVLASKISSADPRKILERGYALALDADGVVMKSAKGYSPGDKMSVMFADGRVTSDVTDVVISTERSETLSFRPNEVSGEIYKL
jgi:exodeoxyribonuclease VII large subunit